MLKRAAKGSLIVLMTVILLAGLARTLFFPKDVNYYENRYAEQVPSLSLSAYLDGSFQDGFEKALTDQVQLAQAFKKLKNTLSSCYLQGIMAPILRENPDRYINFLGLRIFGGDYITYNTRELDKTSPALDVKIRNLNDCFRRHPETDFYLYYIEKDTDIDFETNEKLMAYEYLQERLNLPPEHMDKFSVDSFAEYSDWFFKTDHHWNYKGSYRGYTEVMALLGVTEPLLAPAETVTLPYTLSGSKASQSGAASFREEFTAYRFQYPEFQITVNGSPALGYGDQEGYFAGLPEMIFYGGFYGGDSGEVVFDTGRPERQNLLVIGESYDNAILKLVASHYNVTCSVDLRNYQAQTGREFRLSEYLEEHQIDKVLLIGNIDFFTLEDFLLED